MGFAQPLALWLLLLLPLVAALHQLRSRSAVVVVASLMLWKDAPETTRAETLARRWQPTALLAMQLLALSCGVFALARPYLRTSTAAPLRVVFVLDVSASMKATDVKPSRFDAARNRLLNDASRLPRGARFALVLAANRPELRLGFTTRRSELHEALETLRPTDVSANTAGALSFARALADEADVRLYSDSAVEGYESPEPPVGGRDDDVGIVALDVSRPSDDPTVAIARAVVANHSAKARLVRALVTVDGVAADAASANVEPGASASLSFRFPADGRRDVPVAVAVASDDSYAANDRFYRVLPAVRPLRILVVGEQSAFLDALLRADAATRVRRVSVDAYLESDDNDLTVFYRAVPKSLPRGDSLLIAPPDDLPFAERRDSVSVGAVTWDANHPLTRFCDFGTWSLRRSTRFELGAASRGLVWNGESPLVALSERAESRSLLLAFDAFDTNETDFPLRPLAVVFFENLRVWVESGRRVAPEGVVAGDVVRWGRIERHPDTVELPDGTRETAGSSFSDTRDAGLYRLFADGSPVGAFAVNVAPDERRNAALTAKPSVVPTGARNGEGRRDVWGAFALTALGFLLVEWWVFHRR